MVKEEASTVKKVFLENAASLELDLNEVLLATIMLTNPVSQIPSHVPLSQLAVQGQAYFYAETPDKEKLFGRIVKNFPLQFGREVLADTRLLDMPERVDWKACSTNKEEETDATKQFRKMFSQFDFTME